MLAKFKGALINAVGNLESAGGFVSVGVSESSTTSGSSGRGFSPGTFNEG
jgi:hypothetical protein